MAGLRGRMLAIRGPMNTVVAAERAMLVTAEWTLLTNREFYGARGADCLTDPAESGACSREATRSPRPPG